jgi:hypothetical protein
MSGRLVSTALWITDGVFDYRGQGHAGLAQLQLVAGDAADVEQVVHQPDQLPELALHHLAGLLPRRGVVGQTQDLQPAAERGQRVS